MRLTAENYDIGIAEPTALLHEDDCRIIGIREGDHVRIEGHGCVTAIASMSDTLVRRGTVMIACGVLGASCIRPGEEVEVTAAPIPESVRAIRGKMDGEELSPEEISQIVDDAVHDRLSRIETSAWLTALHIRGMSLRETASYTSAMASTGSVLDFGDRRVFDFHSFGGVPGNKITPIVVSIVASEGLLIPKLSSRAISSACGTADFVEVFCPVTHGSDDVRRITESEGGVFSWTGATDLAPAGDRFIRVQRPLGIDPKPQMLASIMAKKVAAGATDVLMDIPMGSETKVRSPEEAKAYARDLMELGDLLGMRVECAVTYADQPMGVAVGPAPEARECIQVLENRPGHEEVAEKACICAGMILEMAGMCDGTARARECLASSRALERFRAIVRAQGGMDGISSEDIRLGRFSADVVSPRDGFVNRISNKAVVAVAKAAGAPADKGAGLVLSRKRGRKVSKGDVLMTVYSDSEDKLEDALETAAELEPFDIDGMLLDRVRPGSLRWDRPLRRGIELFKYSIHLARFIQLGE